MPQLFSPGLPRRLIVLNAALLAVVLAMVVLNPADASGEQPVTVRARGEYTMVSGRTSQGNVSAVYVLDAANQEMVALRWDANKKSFVGIGYRNLDADSKSQPGR